MDQGSLRCDANVSLRPIGQEEFGTRTETKNVNSLKSVEVAVRYEMRRQAAILTEGGSIHQETRHFHEDGYTSPGRTKETAGTTATSGARPRTGCTQPGTGRGAAKHHSRATVVGTQANSRRGGISDEVMRDLVNAGAVDLVAATVKHGASSESARAWWGNFLVQKANEAGTELDALAITPEQVARSSRSSTRASCQTSWRVR